VDGIRLPSIADCFNHADESAPGRITRWLQMEPPLA
jgi:hypothetical protein